jgi:membrane protease YdiL (CAAX protease family)
MTIPIQIATPASIPVPRLGAGQRAAFFAACFVLEFLAFAILPLSNRFPVSSLLVLHGSLVGVLFVAAQACRMRKEAREYWPVLHALFVGGLAVFLSTHFSDRLLEGLPFAVASPAWIAAAKLAESVWRVVPILLLIGLAGDDLQSLYLRGGRIRFGVSVGMIGLLGCAALAFLPFAAQGGGAKLLSLSPWILVFILSNGFAEELLFRGLFLRRYERFLGQRQANVLAALVFTLLHAQVTYVADTAVFLLVLFALALAWGWLMQKSDSLWGSALFHAGADCLLIFGIYAKG